MDNTDKTRDLVMRYFHSWQEPADYEELRSCMADDVVFDSGSGIVVGADELRQIVEANESPWREVSLLASMFNFSQAVLFYEGVDKQSGVRTRVAEHLTISAGKITHIIAAICPLQ